MQQITVDIDPTDQPVKRKLRPIQVLINRQSKVAEFLVEAADLNSNDEQIGVFNQHNGMYNCSILIDPQDPDDAAGIAWIHSKFIAAAATLQTPVE